MLTNAICITDFCLGSFLIDNDPYLSLYPTVGIWIKHLYKICIFGLLEHILLMKSAEFIHELVTEMTLE